MNQQERRKAELALRKRIKAELIFEQIKAVGFVYCMRCKKKPDWRGICMNHIISLARGGITTKENCELLCFKHHSQKHGIVEKIL